MRIVIASVIFSAVPAAILADPNGHGFLLMWAGNLVFTLVLLIGLRAWAHS